MQWELSWFTAHPSLSVNQRIEELVMGKARILDAYTGELVEVWLLDTFDQENFWAWIPSETRFYIIHCKEVKIV